MGRYSRQCWWGLPGQGARRCECRACRVRDRDMPVWMSDDHLAGIRWLPEYLLGESLSCGCPASGGEQHRPLSIENVLRQRGFGRALSQTAPNPNRIAACFRHFALRGVTSRLMSANSPIWIREAFPMWEGIVLPGSRRWMIPGSQEGIRDGGEHG